MSVNINHNDSIISSSNDDLLCITQKGAIKIGDGTYLDELDKNVKMIEPNEKYKGALRYNKELGLLQYCDGIRWRNIDGKYKQTSNIVYSLLF